MRPLVVLFSLLLSLPKNLRLSIGSLMVLEVFSAVLESSFAVVLIPLVYSFVGIDGDYSQTFSSIPFFETLLTKPPTLILLVALTLFLASYFASFLSSIYRPILSAKVSVHLSTRVFSRILSQPFFISSQSSSSDYLGLLLGEVSTASSSLLLLVSLFRTISVLAIFGMGLLIANPLLTLFLFAIAGFIYSVISLKLKRLLSRMSIRLVELNRRQVSLVQNALGHLRDITLDNSASMFEDAFSLHNHEYRRRQSTVEILSSSPKAVVEMLLITVLIVFCLFNKDRNIVLDFAPLVVPIIYILQRLVLPSAHTLYSYWIRISADSSMVKSVLDYSLLQPALPHRKGVIASFGGHFSLCMENVSFSHPGQRALVLNDFSAEIRSGELIGLVGASGSGKSTLIDVLSGFYPPIKGQVFCICGDEKHLPHEYQGDIAFVPQEVFISDESLLYNITFKSFVEEVDKSSLQKALHVACLDEFVEQLPAGLNTRMGERGDALSGGQRQRVGIARALYKNPSLLILDESTSSLDLPGEALFCSRLLSSASRRMIIIFVTHRKGPLSICSRIIDLSA